MQRFNIYNFTSDYRPVLAGVFHDGGYKVASDSVVLVAVKSEYQEELEHHIIDKDGKEVIGKYPIWRQVLPYGPDYKPYRIDTAQFEDFLKERRAAWKASEGKGTKWGQYKWTVKVGPAYFRAHKFETFLSGMKEICATEILVMDKRHTAYAKTDKGWVLIFPVLYEETENDANIVKLA
jgi:hypothetical protein